MSFSKINNANSSKVSRLSSIQSSIIKPNENGNGLGHDAEESGRCTSAFSFELPMVKSPQSLASLQATLPASIRRDATRREDDIALLLVEKEINDKSKADEDNRVSTNDRPKELDDLEFTSRTSKEFLPRARPKKARRNFDGGWVLRLVKKVHRSHFLVRHLIYISTVVLIILIPLLLGALVFKNASVGGVGLMWFCVWLEIVWLALWASRAIAHVLPFVIGAVATLFTSNYSKWIDLGEQVQISATLFIWWLAVDVSFLPTMTYHHISKNQTTLPWERTVNRIFSSLLVGIILNFLKSILMQIVAMNFHLRTYQDRIEHNEFRIGCLIKLYHFSKNSIGADNSRFETPRDGNGNKASSNFVKEAQQNTLDAISKFGDVAEQIANDFTGKKVEYYEQSRQVVLALLKTTNGSQVLARRLYRTFVHGERETVLLDDLRPAFNNDEEVEAAFSMFDNDLNGDISMEEFEAVCVEIGREKKSITASLKDLDSVISRLNSVLLFTVLIISILVFVSLLSTSAAGVLTSAGSTVLALSWLFSATAQEFLQSIIFVFVKHPFDVGDRVRIYGNTGDTGLGDDYYVKKVSLLYTEFRKLGGHIVQAPNSYLNTLFIMNQRRSGALAEAITLTIKFGTTLDQIERLRIRLLDFVLSEKRDYQGRILTELREVSEVYSIQLNVVFFYKSNWQNELLRLSRRNKFLCALMVAIDELGIEGPRTQQPGFKRGNPMYLQQVKPSNEISETKNILGENDERKEYDDGNDGITSSHLETTMEEGENRDKTSVQPMAQSEAGNKNKKCNRNESLYEKSRKYDFSLGMKDVADGDWNGEIVDKNTKWLPYNKLMEKDSRPSFHSQDSDGAYRSSNDLPRNSDSEVASGRSVGAAGRGRSSNDGCAASIGSQKTYRKRFFLKHFTRKTPVGLPFGINTDEDASTPMNQANAARMMEAGMADIPEVNEPQLTGGYYNKT